ncbi:restriction endonuclease subunit S [Glutamicibacter nicotianae]
MSRIDELITEHCPHGVPFKQLGTIVERNVGGGTPSRSRSDFWDGDIPWASVGDITATGLKINSTRQFITNLGLDGSSSAIVPKGWVVVAVKIAPGAMRVVERDIAINQDIRGLLLGEEMDPYFLAYYFKTIRIAGNGTIVKGITNQTLLRVAVPVPPLEVQREIVRILDTFSKMEAELEAELEARKQQYEHYRRHIFLRSKNTDFLPLAEVCKSISAGGDRPKNLIKGQTVPTEEMPYPIFSNGTGNSALYGFTNSFRISTPAVTISARGTIGAHAIREAHFTPIVRLLVLIPDGQKIDIRYLNYALDIIEIGHSGGSIPQLTVPNVKKIEIPVPPMQEQVRIADALDKFDTLVNDLSVGLPAELAARRKQYEYYRDKLLAFKELEPAS